MKDMAALPITDAINGQTIEAWQHNHWVLLGYDSAEDAWLTPTAARRLAAALLNAADDVEAAQ